MNRTVNRLAILVAGFCAGTPAWASGGMALPEPTDLTLLALGIAGVIVGRRGANRPPQDKPSQD